MPSTISAGTTAGTAIAIAGDTTGALAFQTNGTTTAMTITAGQNVGIGTTSPNQTLQVNGNIMSGNGTAVNPAYNFVGSSAIGMFTPDAGFSVAFSTSSTERMRIDSSGRVTTPYQPGCLVGLTSGNVAAQNIVVFNQIIYNVGSNYNNSNGRFTAPIAGYYYVSASGLGTTSAGVEVSVRKNGAVVVNTRDGGASGYTSASSSAIISAAANDYFDYKVEGAYTVEGTSGYPYTGMCVYLIG